MKTVLAPFSFLFLDEYRLIYLGVDKLGIICYTLVTIKKGDIKNDFYYKGKQR